MAYGDYGAFVYRNGERRRDREDVGTYDTDELGVPVGLRIYANIAKNSESGTGDAWWRHLQHGVMGDGRVRVACYKYGMPDFYVWEDGKDEPTQIDVAEVVKANGWEAEVFVKEFRGAQWLDWLEDYDLVDFTVPGLDGYLFSATHFDGDETFFAAMTEPDGTRWECSYGYGYGSGFEDDD